MAYITGITGVALLHSPWIQNATAVLPGAYEQERTEVLQSCLDTSRCGHKCNVWLEGPETSLLTDRRCSVDAPG